MKHYVLIGLILITLLVSGCLAPEDVNKKIANTYKELNSLSYDMQISTIATFDKPLTTYKITQVQTGTTKVMSDKIVITREEILIEENEKEGMSVTVSMYDPSTEGYIDIAYTPYSWIDENGNLRSDLMFDSEGNLREAYDMPVYGPVIGESQTITGASGELNSSVFIEKPDKKAIIVSGSHSAHSSGGETINGKWYNRLDPAGPVPETKDICTGNTKYETGQAGPGGADLGGYAEGEAPVDWTKGKYYVAAGEWYLFVISNNAINCKDFIDGSIWQVPAALDDPTKFKVSTAEELLDGVKVIGVEVESVTGEPFTFEASAEPLFQRAKLWFDPIDFKLIKFIGTFEKSAKSEINEAGEEISVGITETYTVTFKNVVFNPEIPLETFEVDLSKYALVKYTTAAAEKPVPVKP